ncbi:MAG: single-stranded DNA-binding protein [Ignavibacteria bacterium]|nr:MAG: single-stranded DNA-binding protein [Ignavibacteria bacterium]
MSDLRMPELNSVTIAGNLTKDPVFRKTSNNTPVVNFHIASNRRYKDSNNKWQEDVCYVGIVAWNKLAESCMNRIKKGSAVLVEGELQSRIVPTRDGKTRSIIEVKAQRIQFLNRSKPNNNGFEPEAESSKVENSDDSLDTFSMDDDNSFDKFLTDEESDLMNDDNN